MGQIINIEMVCFQEDAWSRDFIDYALQVFFVPGLFIGKRLAGYGAYHIRGKIFYIDNIAILPEYRQKGLGKLLMVYFRDMAIRNKCTEELLQVNVNNGTAIYIYRKMGFEEARLLKGYYQRKNGNSEDAYLMVNHLPAGINNRSDRDSTEGE